ncbi:hypothetical protein Lesp02_02030 [Lentzea sp. NBRC 105346]|nr:hypothetical protein Lesp02_02030 [Lentzea sp. NBRC 105346]
MPSAWVKKTLPVVVAGGLQNEPYQLDAVLTALGFTVEASALDTVPAGMAGATVTGAPAASVTAVAEALLSGVASAGLADFMRSSVQKERIDASVLLAAVVASPDASAVDMTGPVSGRSV